MTLRGEPFTPKAPADAIADDVYMVPEDRAGTIIKDWSIARPPPSRSSAMSPDSGPQPLGGGQGRRVGMKDFGVVAQSEDDPVISLSGGNQQKVVVGRWLRKQPTVMILNEPFQGVDVGARHDLAERTREVAAAGVGRPGDVNRPRRDHASV